ncbi:hypothetical protein HQ447_12215 [bacterium]|nr:hypothetical protein [bacterium]
MHHLLSAILGASVFDEMLRLIGIAAIIHAVFKGIKSLRDKPAAEIPRPVAAPVAASAPVAAAAVDSPIAPEIVAVIAAAIASTLGSSHRIVSIKRQSSTWERAGRQSVLTSHRIR